MYRYGFLSGFSGQSLYEQWIYQMYNIVFTAFPIIWFAVFDEQHPKEKLMTVSKYYKVGLLSKYYAITNHLDENFSRGKFWRWVFYGAAQGAFVMCLTTYTIEGADCSYDENGQPSNQAVTGILVYGLIVIVANFKLMSSTNVHSF